MMDTKLQFSTVYHPQADGETEVMNHSLDSLLQYLVGDHLRLWDLVLSIAKFAYNSSVNRSIGMRPFEIVTGYKPQAPIDLIPMSITHRSSELASAFAHHIYALYEEIKRRITLNNERYKRSADSRRV